MYSNVVELLEDNVKLDKIIISGIDRSDRADIVLNKFEIDNRLFCFLWVT